ncbi:hypothetical protein J8273_8193 [Carpediemonas membranifera]|uniref:Uncharacterized protein n=1 Tax=Carpediemonas membranifera TaxID=201153 RepID=A0A8J6AWM6_9EUKA|nr:hypothetical protein J8273_8193 [Carpediemonas membranifera]|eukprot:KAG9390153.1 hypothetical protein J8273_8193 [Carpediemonas membranifera]
MDNSATFRLPAFGNTLKHVPGDHPLPRFIVGTSSLAPFTGDALSKNKLIMIEYDELNASIAILSTTDIDGEVQSLGFARNESLLIVLAKNPVESFLMAYSMGIDAALTEEWRLAVDPSILLLTHPTMDNLCLVGPGSICLVDTDAPKDMGTEIYRTDGRIRTAAWLETVPDRIVIGEGHRVIVFSLKTMKAVAQGSVEDSIALRVSPLTIDDRIYTTGTDGRLTAWASNGAGTLAPTHSDTALPHFGTALSANTLYTSVVLVGGAYSSTVAVADVHAAGARHLAALQMPLPEGIGVEETVWSAVDPFVAAVLGSDGTLVVGRLPGSVRGMVAA